MAGKPAHTGLFFGVAKPGRVRTPRSTVFFVEEACRFFGVGDVAMVVA